MTARGDGPRGLAGADVGTTTCEVGGYTLDGEVLARRRVAPAGGGDRRAEEAARRAIGRPAPPPRSAVLPRDDVLAEQYEPSYRDFLSRAQEAAVTDLAHLSRPAGGLAMVAMDQRESLRTMLAEHTSGPVPDADLVAFKVAVAGALGPHASGFLIDRTFGFDRVVDERLLPRTCGLILAADSLVHPPGGGPVETTRIDDGVHPANARDRGAAALKLLVLWRRDGSRDARLAMAAEFVRRCADAGLVSILEGVARPGPDDDFDSLLLEAATELGALRPSLYKAQVPRHGHGDPVEVGRLCEQVTAAVPVPWVVLSQGVSVADFPAAVTVACRAGASGFLAGRAIWSDTLADPASLLRTRSVDRLRRLGDVVDSTARPWREAAA